MSFGATHCLVNQSVHSDVDECILQTIQSPCMYILYSAAYGGTRVDQ